MKVSIMVALSNYLNKRLYRFNIPLFLVAFSVGIIIADYFVSPTATPVFEQITTELRHWASITETFILAYSYLVLLMWHTRRVVVFKEQGLLHKSFFGSSVTLIVFVIFLLIGLVYSTSHPYFSDFYKYTAGYVRMGAVLSWLNIPYLTYRRVSLRTREMTLFFIIFMVVLLGELPLLTEFVPQIRALGDWTERTLGVSGQRVGVLVMSIGALTVALRALVGKERGLIELEVS